MNFGDLIKELKRQLEKEPKGYDTEAEVVQIEDDIAWVQIPGGDEPTPVKMTIDAKEGDTVQVRLSGGNAFLVGNATAPPTDDTQANIATVIAQDATEAAGQAQADIDEEKEYFWHDDSGAHIQGSTSGYRNDLKSDGMHIVEVDTGTEVAKFGATMAQIGKDNSSHFVVEKNAIKLIDYDGNIYFHLSDLRSQGQATATEVFDGNGLRTSFALYATCTRLVLATVNGIDVTSTCTRDWLHNIIEFASAPPSGAEVIIEYKTPSYESTAFTYGSRKATGDIGILSFASGQTVIASGIGSHAEGNSTEASGAFSVALNCGTKAKKAYQTAIGRFNAIDDESGRYGQYAFIIGNGQNSVNRSNAFAVKWDGTVNTAKGMLTSQTATTTWAEVVENEATKINGGYFVEGKHVYVSISCNLNSAASADALIELFYGLPEPLFLVPLACSVANTQRGVAWITTDGELRFRPTASVSTSNTIVINGHYVSA